VGRNGGRAIAVAVGVIVLAAICALGRVGGDLAAAPSALRVQATPVPTLTPTPKPSKPVDSPASLVKFDTCPELLTHLRAEARKRVEPYGLAGAGYAVGTVSSGGSAAAVGAAPGRTSGSTAPRAVAARIFKPPSFSRTNVQEADVDEPDVVKTDGRHIFTLRPNPDDRSRQRLTSIAVEDGRPALTGGVLLPKAGRYELLLAGNRVLAMASDGYSRRGARTIVAVVDVTDPADMRITDVVRLEGSYASARMVGGVARLVLNSAVGPEFERPTGWTKSALKKAKERNLAVIDRARIEDWFPRYKVEDASGNKRSEGPLCTCATTYRPKSFAGFGTSSVVTIDPDAANPRNSAGVLGASETIYASSDNLYVATRALRKPSTSLHRFDISDPKGARYAASGLVRGSVLNQWSLDEHEGTLRVATTEREGRASSASTVTVLDVAGPELKEVGRVGGLGKGERIYGVRFMGDTGYVVTFRQIDPLHVVDLSDPRKPRVAGELKIPGYSAYLHPTDDGRLLGIGQDVDPKRGFPLGTQVSLFDVSDPTKPGRIDKTTYENTRSHVDEDHHAFLYWEPERLALVPIEGHGERPNGIIAMRVGRDGFAEAGRVSHKTHAAKSERYAIGIYRSLVVEDVLYTLSSLGIAATDLATFTERGWAALR
jgi:uncharacterized secreted protein with C-terminal beta-propeller domain